jgi:hypothetical protein
LSVKVFGKLGDQKIPALARAATKRMCGDPAFSHHLLDAARRIVKKFGGGIGFNKRFDAGQTMFCQ